MDYLVIIRLTSSQVARMWLSAPLLSMHLSI